MSKKQKIAFLTGCLLVVLIPTVFLLCSQTIHQEMMSREGKDAFITESVGMKDSTEEAGKEKISNPNKENAGNTSAVDQNKGFISYILFDSTISENSIKIPLPDANMPVTTQIDLIHRQVTVYVQNDEGEKNKQWDESFWQNNPILCNLKLKSFQIQRENTEVIKFIFVTDELYDYEKTEETEENCANICLLAKRPSARRGRIIVIDPMGGGEEKGICIYEDGTLVDTSGEKTADTKEEADFENAKASSKLLLSESAITYTIACLVRERLEKENVYVYLTRSEMENPSMQERADMINGLGADFFVGLTCGYDEDSSVYGMKTRYNENYFIPGFSGADLAYILLEKTAQITDEKALGFDGNVQNEELLSLATLPAAEIEIGYLSNRQEQKLLQKNEYLQRVAEGIAEGILEAYKEIEK